MTQAYELKDVVDTTALKEAFGDYITLEGDGESETYEILKEFKLGANEYAALQPAGDDEADIELFRITRDEQGELGLENIEDDEEWETVSELFDEMTFGPEDEA